VLTVVCERRQPARLANGYTPSTWTWEQTRLRH
jgi:hypothetical protein